MEKRTILAIVLSLAVLLGFQYFFPPAPQQEKVTQAPAASTEPAENSGINSPPSENRNYDSPNDSAQTIDSLQKGEIITIQNSLYRAEFETLGGQLKAFYLKVMAKKWYVVNTYSGHENRVKLLLEEKIKSQEKEEFFSEVLVPSEKVIEIGRGGGKKTTARRLFPSYILIKMDLNKETWHLVKNTPKVTGFLGETSKPTPLSDEKVQEIMDRISEGSLKPRPKVSFEKGDNVRIIDGAFSNFNGVVEEVKPDKGRVKVLVTIFGRSTPIELDFLQVKKN